MCKPLDVVGQNDAIHAFVPQFGVGAIAVTALNAVATQVIDEAEQIALTAERDALPEQETLRSALNGRQ
jgi:hypothetical protein